MWKGEAKDPYVGGLVIVLKHGDSRVELALSGTGSGDCETGDSRLEEGKELERVTGC